MKKVKLTNSPLIYPLPAVLIGAVMGGKPNYCTAGNCGIISVEPAAVYTSLDRKHYTGRGILENKWFSINIPSVDHMVQVDYCGLVSGSKIDKSHVFRTFYGENEKAPLIEECPINLVCELIKSFDIYNMTVYIGEVKETYASESVLTGGLPDTKKIGPLIYNMDNRYWSIGDVVGSGFAAGKNYK